MSLNKTWIEDCPHEQYCDLGCCRIDNCTDDCGYWQVDVVIDYQHQRKPFEGHYPNKNEAKVLRRIMSQTGLTEKEVRGIKKYRIMLAEAGKVRELTSMEKATKEAKLLLKHITQDLKLAKEHPKVIEEYYKRRDSGYYYNKASHFQITHEYACK